MVPSRDGGTGLWALAAVLAVLALDDGTLFYAMADHVAMPLLRAVADPEQAHDFAIWALATGLMPKVRQAHTDRQQE